MNELLLKRVEELEGKVAALENQIQPEKCVVSGGTIENGVLKGNDVSIHGGTVTGCVACC